MKDNSYYSKLISELSLIAEKYKFVSVTYLCNSILGANIPIITLGEGHKKIIYLGGQAGNDSLTPYILMRYVKDICSLYQENGAVFGFSAEYILKKFTVIIIPLLNPDGLNYSDIGVLKSNPIYDRILKLNNGSSDFSHWRGNARGIDLRQNYFWEEEQEIEPEPEVGAFCNFLRFGQPPEMIFSFDITDKKESTVYFGDGESASKIAIALTQMTRFRRKFFDDGDKNHTLMSWSNQNIGRKTFLIEISDITQKEQSSRKEDRFEKYLEMRKMLFCAPILSKIK